METIISHTATVIIYTDIEQSKKLAEILPIESADMYYWHGYERLVRVNNGNCDYDKYDIPAWSLAALLDIIPEGVTENYDAPNIQKENGLYTIAYGNDNLLCIADNPVDACYKMILKLYELDMLHFN